MNKKYAIKFKNSIKEAEKNAILALGVIVQCVVSFGIYLVELSKEMFFSLKENNSLLYIKESA